MRYRLYPSRFGTSVWAIRIGTLSSEPNQTLLLFAESSSIHRTPLSTHALGALPARINAVHLSPLLPNPEPQNRSNVSTLSGRNFSLFKFRLLTSQDSHVHSLSHGNPITPLTPLYLYPLYDLHNKTNTDKNRTFSTRLWYSRVVQRQRQQTSVTKI